MNGAQSLFEALTGAGLDTCFANPGTSEMQLVYEIGRTNTVRPVLCLQENVVTGAADGYARMAGKPAFTLLHVGSGFANGIANLHNAGRANTPMVNVVGANATYHQPNFPEHELIGGRILDLARSVSHWAREARSASELGLLGAEAARVAMTGAGRIATLVAPTNCHWDPAPGAPEAEPPPAKARVRAEDVDSIRLRLGNGSTTALLLGSHALREPNLTLAGRIAAHTGATLLAETFPSRLSRGAGRPQVQIVPYFFEFARELLGRFETIILIGALPPVSTFAYRGQPVNKAPDACELVSFLSADHDITHGLNALLEATGAGSAAPLLQPPLDVAPPEGALTPEAVGASVGLLLPENAILVDEGATAGLAAAALTAGAPPHDYLYAIGGGAIGGGLPVALGAALACPDRKVVALQADGSAMYTNQALWSLARERADVTVVLLRNDAYAILDVELARVNPGEATPAMRRLLDLDDPSLDWVQLAASMGVPGVAVDRAETFHAALAEALAEPGPRLIEARLDQDLSPVVDLIRRNSPPLP